MALGLPSPSLVTLQKASLPPREHMEFREELGLAGLSHVPITEPITGPGGVAW